jgi:integrase
VSVQQKAGRWYPVLYLGRDPRTGKKRFKWLDGFASKRDAEVEERKQRKAQDDGTFVKPSSETMRDFLARWLRHKHTDGTAPTTLQRYTDIVNGRLIPAFGTIRVRKLEPRDILDQQVDWLENGVSVQNRGGTPRVVRLKKRTVLHYRRVLHAALEDAVKWRVRGDNPSHAADMPSVDDAPEMITLDETEARALRDLASTQPDDMRTQLVLVALHMGMRLGELQGLRRRDVDLKTGTLSVRQTVNQLRGRPRGEGLVIRPNCAKTKQSRRTLALTSGARAALVRAFAIQSEQLKNAGSAWIDNALVFTTDEGRPLNPQWLRVHFYGLLQQAGTSRITLKNLRHTHATLMLLNGEHPKVVSERLGHSRISTTLDVYSHVLPNLETAAAARFDELLGTTKLEAGLEKGLEERETETQRVAHAF